jgi:hypothetical protein
VSQAKRNSKRYKRYKPHLERRIHVEQCNKYGYPTKKLAKAELTRLIELETREGKRPGKLVVYRCQCGYYHCGHDVHREKFQGGEAT